MYQQCNGIRVAAPLTLVITKLVSIELQNNIHNKYTDINIPMLIVALQYRVNYEINIRIL